MEMDDYLNDVCSVEDLKKFELKYNEELCRGEVTSVTQFEYSCFLIRSRYPADIERGIILLEELYKRPSESGKRDYVFYLAVGNARLKEYQVSLNYLKGLLKVEPGNRQVQDLQAIVKKKMEMDAMKGAAIAGGAVLGVGALLGLAIALSRK